MSEPIRLTLLFAGGHQHTVKFASDDPNFLQLIGLFASGDPAAKQRAFVELALEGGERGISFTLDHLVGLVTEPKTSIAALLNHAPLHTAPAALKPGTVPSIVWQLDNFLPPDVCRRLIEFTLASERNFVSTQVDSDDVNYRASSVLHQFPEFAQLFKDRVGAMAGELADRFAVPGFAPSEVECQLTGHNDGNYYRVHNDNGSPQTASRQFTYVYYFNHEPKAFEGGQLRVYDSRIENNFYVQAETYRDVEPRNNSIVFFQSYCLHEVLPVRCASQLFEDSRFTVNGWLRR